jgi:sensor domain CHASE-containing protein
MTFFNFQNSEGGGSGSSSDNSTSSASSSPNPPVVSNQFWIYWVVTVPLTIVIVLTWYIWERRREKRYAEEDTALEKGVESMEIQIQSEMRKRTMSKVATWDTKTTGD